MPDWFILPGIIIATIAAIIASQALISGSYTLISEAISLNLWPKMTIKYPTELKGQMYIPLSQCFSLGRMYFCCSTFQGISCYASSIWIVNNYYHVNDQQFFWCFI